MKTSEEDYQKRIIYQYTSIFFFHFRKLNINPFDIEVKVHLNVHWGFENSLIIGKSHWAMNFGNAVEITIVNVSR